MALASGTHRRSTPATGGGFPPLAGRSGPLASTVDRPNRRADPHRPATLGLEHELGLCVTGTGTPLAAAATALRLFLRSAGVDTFGPPSEQFLENGARLYIDCGEHPEYASPECSTPAELVAADAAGMRLLGDAARRTELIMREMFGPLDLHVVRNNASPSGLSWGTHENYLTSNSLGWDELVNGLASHLASRVAFCGAGTVLPGGDLTAGAQFRLSQRAPYIGTLFASTAGNQFAKPMVLTRDEPLADPRRFRRVQVVCGDANMAQTATLLKIGTTSIALRLVEAGAAPDATFDDPVGALRHFGGPDRPDPHRGEVGALAARRSAGRRQLSAIDMQRCWLDAAERHHDRIGLPTAEAELLGRWADVLDRLATDPDSLAGDLDWVAKRRLVDAVCDRDAVAPSDPRVVALDLAYHDLHPDRSLAQRLERRGLLARVVAEDAVATLEREAPQTTRAAARGALIRALRRRGRPFGISWAQCDVDAGAGRENRVELLDPAVPYPPAALVLLDELARTH